ncbi:MULTISPECIES: DUF4856 domain-containing protein [unclassified Aureispira]|uniref:DUF4856 domain-containing protein n=1 Tax=unclassified Aureispira TaxID=2649989 RepID=UPI0006964041|nr:MULTISPECIES: DUF4856 domain-containing protein [unclassified Aureispira]WMX12987.1 DUF4856 domain-containing protein [Aureispira sp. CCB-E]
MFSNHNFIAFLAVTLLCFFSCEKKEIIYDVPSSYNFENVNYEGQNQRIEMLTEFMAYVKSASNAGISTISKATMLNMYQNTNAPFSNPALNQASTQLKNKTHPEAQFYAEDLIEELEIVSQNMNVAASVGNSGVMVDAASGGRYLLNENGVELGQVLEKLLVGATFYYQITQVYLGENKINTDNKGVIAGRGTNMEHHWDEAFGYFGVPKDFPSTTSDLLYLGNYSDKTNSIIGSNSKIMDEFLKGRAAISAKDYPTRDSARVSLKKSFEILMAATSISFLNDAKANVSRLALYYHNLSKAYGNIMGLRYGAYTTLSDAEIDLILTYIGGSPDPLDADFYNASGQNIDKAIDAIADAFSDLTAVKNSL